MTSKERQEKIKNLQEELTNYQGWRPLMAAFGTEVLAYITDEKAPFPTTPNPNDDFYEEDIVAVFAPIHEWESMDMRLLEVITHPNYWRNPKLTHRYSEYFFESFFNNYFDEQLALQEKGIDIVTPLLNAWKQLNLDENEIVRGIVEYINTSAWYLENGQPSYVGKYLIARAQRNLDELMSLFADAYNDELFDFMVKHNPSFTEAEYEKFLALKKDDSEVTYISTSIAKTLLEKDSAKYESVILEKINEIQSADCILNLYKLLGKFFPGKYEKDEIEQSFNYIRKVNEELKIKGEAYYFNTEWTEARDDYDYIFIRIAKKLLTTGLKEAQTELTTLYELCQDGEAKEEILKLLHAHYKEEILPAMLSKGLNCKKNSSGDTYFSTFFKLLGTMDYTGNEDKVWAMTLDKDKKVRELASVALGKLGDKAIPEARKLLSNKKSDIRQTGALILSLIGSDASIAVLSEVLDTEQDDNARDIMLQSLQGLLPTPQTEEAMKVVIAQAKARKKLDKPVEHWLTESNFPKLYWLSGNELTDEEVRFLFYRQTRTKDIRLDSEVKQFLNLLDKSKSHKFANALLKGFISTGADSKSKYTMPLATSLGGDDEINLLKSKVIEWVDNARGKMAEYAVKAIALNGSNKALRLIEFYSRKYKSKYKNIGAAADESFTLVAEELGIPPYELADSIIPDFGFDGLFKEFEAGGETYRAYVSNDFKIMFLDEDNKVIKSLPKAASAELKEEFKDMAKEIRDIVKAQSGRLEQYLVIQRKWDSDKWQAFFLNNPVMFAYAIRLIWAAYSPEGELLYTFCCNEDQTLVNREGDEIELDENLKIAMVHPISLDAETVAYWNQHLLDADITTIFPQLSRPVILMKEGDKNTKISKYFNGVQFGGYGMVSKMDKTGWNRGSVVDAGTISSFFKDFSTLGITAIIEQQGILCVGYYEENAELGNLYFVKNKSVKFGSYTYDEPNDENDSRLIAFGDVPPIVYSEVMADLEFYKENDAKKES